MALCLLAQNVIYEWEVFVVLEHVCIFRPTPVPVYAESKQILLLFFSLLRQGE